MKCKTELSEKEKEFNREFWRTTNTEYGQDGFKRNAMTRAVDVYTTALKYNPKTGMASA